MKTWEKNKDELVDYLNSVSAKDVYVVIKIIWNTLLENKRIFIIGNGGSCANASHFAQDLCKTTYPNSYGLTIDTKNKTFKAISLCDNIAFITAIANDNGYRYIFYDQLKTFDPKVGDVLFAISGSGKSINILEAIDLANKLEMTTIGLTGYDGGELIEKANFKIHVKTNNMLFVESIHSIILHYIVETLTIMRLKNNV